MPRDFKKFDIENLQKNKKSTTTLSCAF
jgi:hypothetical protein